MTTKDFRKKNKAGWDTETPMRVDDVDLHQESVTDAMRGENNIPDATSAGKERSADKRRSAEQEE